MFQIQALNNAIEKANRVRIKHGIESTAPIDELKAHLQSVEGILLALIDEAKATRLNGHLTEAGIKARLAELREDAVGKLASIDRASKLTSKLERMQADLVGRVKRTRDEAKQKDKVLDAGQQQEIRRYLSQVREEARRKHQQALEEAQQTGRILSDQERAYADPAAALFLAGCSAYAPDKEVALSSVMDAQWPLQVLPPEVIEQGVALLHQCLEPELTTAIKHHVAALEMDGVAMKDVAEVVAHPEKVAVRSTPHIARPDKKGA